MGIIQLQSGRGQAAMLASRIAYFVFVDTLTFIAIAVLDPES
jgi:hypothetical protein